MTNTEAGLPLRRDVLRAAAAAGAVAALPTLAAGEPPPETKRIRLPRYPVDVACVSPMWAAEELLRAEGFEDVSYVTITVEQLVRLTPEELKLDTVDFSLTEIHMVLPALDAGNRIVSRAGIHGGCYELFGAKALRSIRDLKGKTIAVATSPRRTFVSTMLINVGLNPAKDVTFVETFDGVRLLAEGKIDATLGYPPEPQVMREKKIGVSLVNTATDRPWSQYFCCMAIANRDFVEKYPVATKRALRALLKATDLCAAEPERTARGLVERGFVKDYEHSLQVLREVPYKRWREYDAADSLRFHALRMHEAGFIKTNPQKLLAQGTNWRFLEQLKRELKT